MIKTLIRAEKKEHEIVEELDQGSESLNSLRFQKDLNVLIFFTHHPDNINQYLRERFFMMHHKNQILVCTYQETISSSHQKQIEGNMEVTITSYQSKEADQQLIRNTLHFLSSCVLFYKVVIKTVDTGVMIPLIAYLSDIL